MESTHTNLFARACRSILGINFTVTLCRTLSTSTTYDPESKHTIGYGKKNNSNYIKEGQGCYWYLCKVALVCTNLHSNPSVLRKFNRFASNRKDICHLFDGNKKDLTTSKNIAHTLASLQWDEFIKN